MKKICLSMVLFLIITFFSSMVISCKKDDDCLTKCKNYYKECIKNAEKSFDTWQITRPEYDLAIMQCDKSRSDCFSACSSSVEDNSYNDYDDYSDYEDEDEDEYYDEGEFSGGDEYSDEGEYYYEG